MMISAAGYRACPYSLDHRVRHAPGRGSLPIRKVGLGRVNRQNTALSLLRNTQGGIITAMIERIESFVRR